MVLCITVIPGADMANIPYTKGESESMGERASKASRVCSFAVRALPWLTGLVGLGLMLVGLLQPAWLPRWAARTALWSVGLTAAMTLVQQAQEGAARRGLLQALTLVATAAAATTAGGWAGHTATGWAAGCGLAAWAVTLGGLAAGFLAGLAAGLLAKRTFGARRSQ